MRSGLTRSSEFRLGKSPAVWTPREPAGPDVRVTVKVRVVGRRATHWLPISVVL